VGIPIADISVLKQLTELYIPPSNFFVQPYLGITSKTPQFIPHENEVEAIIEVPLHEFLNDAVKTTQSLNTSYAKNIQVPAFHLQGHVVWGATAMMLNEIHAILKQVV